jgi:hypothetical protein
VRSALKKLPRFFFAEADDREDFPARDCVLVAMWENLSGSNDNQPPHTPQPA